jgi:hypothetical protein
MLHLDSIDKKVQIPMFTINKFRNHPRDKQTVADRLANSGKNLLYGSNFRSNGPVVRKRKINLVAEPKAILNFQPIDIVEDAPGQITITYDTNIRIAGLIGFAV